MQERLYINDFNKGLIADVDKRALPLGACSEGANVRLCDNTIKIREGRVYHADLPGTGADPTMLFEYRRAGATLQQLAAGFDEGDENGPGLLLAQGDTLYYASNNSDQQTFTAVTGLTLATGQRTRAAQYKDIAYIVDGTNPVVAWTPDGIMVLADKVKPEAAPVATPVSGEVRTLADCSAGEVSGKHTGYSKNFAGTAFLSDTNVANSARWHTQPLYGKASTVVEECAGVYLRKFIAQQDKNSITKPMPGLEIISNDAVFSSGTFDLSARMITPLSPEVQ